MFSWRPSSTTPATAVADTLIERLNGVVAVAIGLAGTGRPMDLAGLQGAAGTLCAQVLDLPPGLGQHFRPALMELEARLATLESLVRHPPQAALV